MNLLHSLVLIVKLRVSGFHGVNEELRLLEVLGSEDLRSEVESLTDVFVWRFIDATAQVFGIVACREEVFEALGSMLELLSDPFRKMNFVLYQFRPRRYPHVEQFIETCVFQMLII